MTETLSALITRTRAVLDDPDSDRYTDAQITQAIRLALRAYAQYRPRATSADVAANGTKEIPLTSLTVERVFRVLWDETDLAFYVTFTDNVATLTLSTAISTGETLTVHYTLPHTLSGLDSATETTFEDYDADGIALGAAGYALLSRADSRAETNNLNPNLAASLRLAAQEKLQEFRRIFENPPGAAVAYWTLDTADHYEP